MATCYLVVGGTLLVTSSSAVNNAARLKNQIRRRKELKQAVR
jgi:hypothetical protein